MINRDYKIEIRDRVSWIKNLLKESEANGIIFGNSGGKDSAVVGTLCKLATDNVLGVIMPCGNINTDKEHALLLANKFKIETKEVNLQDVYGSIVDTLEIAEGEELMAMAKSNIKPRLRMITLYTLGQHKRYLVAGTGNKSEATMGYFTKWGDGACDFNPIADLTVTEVLAMGKVLGIPDEILQKKSSAGLWVGQTDEEEMGITYAAIDKYILNGEGNREDIIKIENIHKKTQHKREMPIQYNK